LVTRYFPGELEQVHVRGMKRRGPRLELVAGLGMALAMPMLPAMAAGAQSSSQDISTQTSLTVETRDQGGQTQAATAVTVTGDDGLPATGVVDIKDGSRILTEVKLNGSGQANAVLSLPGGSHTLQSVYAGDGTHQSSSSSTTGVEGLSGGTPNFQLSLAGVAPTTLPLTLTAGQSGTIEVTVTPVNNGSLTTPMFVTLSCSGLPDQAACTFSPESVEILSSTPTSCPTGSPASSCPPTSQMELDTQAATAQLAAPAAGHGKGSSPIAWAFLLPGTLGLGGLAWGARRRRWLQRLALMALVGLVTTLGTTACNPLYYYRNHGPPPPPATPAGTYTITVTGQSNNGVTAITNSTTFVLTVN